MGLTGGKGEDERDVYATAIFVDPSILIIGCVIKQISS
jgi:hypothetical protein